MSTPDKPDHARGWLYVQKLIDEEEVERVAKLSEEERRAEFADDGLEEPDEEWSADEILGLARAMAEREAAAVAVQAPPAKADPAPAPAAEVREPPEAAAPPQPPAQVVPIRAKKPWTTWLLAAAVFAFLGIVIKAALPTPGVTAPPPIKEYVATLRNDAVIDCEMKHWMMCRQRLDEAARYDPAGDGEPRIVKLREAIAAGLAANAGDAH